MLAFTIERIFSPHLVLMNNLPDCFKCSRCTRGGGGLLNSHAHASSVCAFWSGGTRYPHIDGPYHCGQLEQGVLVTQIAFAWTFFKGVVPIIEMILKDAVYQFTEGVFFFFEMLCHPGPPIRYPRTHRCIYYGQYIRWGNKHIYRNGEKTTVTAYGRHFYSHS